MNIKEAKNSIKQIIRQDIHLPVLIWSSPGIGKSQACKQIAKELGWEFIDIRLPLLMPSDLLGLPYPDKEHKKANWLYPSFFPDPKSNKKYLILFDEIGNSTMAVQNSCYRIILDRSVGEHYKFPKGVKMVAASNYITDQSGINRLSKALANRFTHFFVEAEIDAWKDWAMKNKINDKVIAFLGFKNNMLSQKPSTEDQAFPTPRSWEKVSDFLNAGIATEGIIEGTVGKGPASEFLSYIEIYSNLPNIDDILNGKKVRVSKEPSILYAISSSLAIRANAKNIENIFNFCSKLDKEIEVLTIRDIARKDDVILRECSKFPKWLDAHSEYFDFDEGENNNTGDEWA